MFIPITLKKLPVTPNPPVLPSLPLFYSILPFYPPYPSNRPSLQKKKNDQFMLDICSKFLGMTMHAPNACQRVPSLVTSWSPEMLGPLSYRDRGEQWVDDVKMATHWGGERHPRILWNKLEEQNTRILQNLLQRMHYLYLASLADLVV